MLLFCFPYSFLAHLTEVVRRAAAVAPLASQFFAQDGAVPAHVELARNAPQRLAGALVALHDLDAPQRVVGELALARRVQRDDALGQRSEVRRLGEGGRGHRLERVEVPDLDLGVERADGDVVARGAFGGGGGGGGEVEPFEAEGEVGEHEVVVAVEVLLRVVVDVDFELGDLVFGLGDDDEVVGGEDLELFAFVIVFGVLEMMSGGRDVPEGLRTSFRVMYGSSLLSL